MLSLTLNDQPCVALTDELASILAANGEEVPELNKLVWPVGASCPAKAVFLVHSDAAQVLSGGDRTTGVAVKFSDDTLNATQGTFTATMYQVEHRPVHIALWQKDIAALYAVTLVDARYFWQGKLTDKSFDVTTTTDRTAFYDETKNTGSTWTWAGILTELAGLLGITLDVSAVTGTTGDPTDYLLTSDSVALTIDRICTALGMVFVAGVDGTYSVVLPSSLNANSFLHNTTFLKERIAGGTVRDVGIFDGQQWIDAVMPSSVNVRFPRQIPSGADTHDATDPPPLRQFYVATSTNGKPPGTTGRANYATVINDALWAIGPIGSETNATALQARADYLASVFYQRYGMSVHDVRLMGFVNLGKVPGTVVWRLTAGGPFTDLHVRAGPTDFGRDCVIGLGGIQTHRTMDGALIISGAGSKDFRVKLTAHSGSFPQFSYSGYQTTGFDGTASWLTTGSLITGIKNRMETNVTTGEYGTGVPITSSSGQVNSTACVIKPIGVGSVVDVTVDTDPSGNTIYSFAQCNSAW